MALARPHAHRVPVVQTGQTFRIRRQQEDQGYLTFIRVVIDGGAAKKISAWAISAKTLASVDQETTIGLGCSYGGLAQPGDTFHRVNLRVGNSSKDHQFLGGDPLQKGPGMFIARFYQVTHDVWQTEVHVNGQRGCSVALGKPVLGDAHF